MSAWGTWRVASNVDVDPWPITARGSVEQQVLSGEKGGPSRNAPLLLPICLQNYAGVCQ